jgi:hypothetical protein
MWLSIAIQNRRHVGARSLEQERAGPSMRPPTPSRLYDDDVDRLQKIDRFVQIVVAAIADQDAVAEAIRTVDRSVCYRNVDNAGLSTFV